MSSGKIVQIIGSVVDVEFPQENVPGIYSALNVTEKNLTMKYSNKLVAALYVVSLWVLLKVYVAVLK